VTESGLHLHQSEPHSCGNIQQNGYELRRHLNANSVFKFSFPCNQDSAYVKIYHIFK